MNRSFEEYQRRLMEGLDLSPGKMFPYPVESLRPSLREEFPSPTQTKGCGDPDCAMCNPEIAERRRRDGTAGTPYGGGRSPYPTPSPAPTINDDLEEAREAVEAWICEAPEQAFDDIVGNDEALGQLRAVLEAPVKHRELYEAYSMKMPKGALLSGPPGCGKTMFARAAASELARMYEDDSREFLLIAGSELQSMFVGETESSIKAIFRYAQLYKEEHSRPLLVFIDEAEVLFPDRTGRVRRTAPWEESRVATFLAEMDGVRESGAFIMLASNRPEVIDQALLRDGRCDFKIQVRRPTREAISIILERGFAATFNKDSPEDLLFTAIESLFDPHRVILSKIELTANLDTQEVSAKEVDHFRLEHIISGAMAVSLPERCKRFAFARDLASGEPSGITTADVIAAVNALFEENKDLDHSFALQEFIKEHAE